MVTTPTFCFLVASAMLLGEVPPLPVPPPGNGKVPVPPLPGSVAPGSVEPGSVLPGSVDPLPEPEPPLGTTSWADPEPVIVTEWSLDTATPVATSAAAATAAV